MSQPNRMQITFAACPENESFARVVIAAFAVRKNPTVGEMADIKTAVSEAVTNAIVHGYPNARGDVRMSAEITPTGELTVEVADTGVGIPNIAQAMQPFFTTGPEEERSGMGFAVMQTFMDDVSVVSAAGAGTTVRMRKAIRAAAAV